MDTKWYVTAGSPLLEATDQSVAEGDPIVIVDLERTPGNGSDLPRRHRRAFPNSSAARATALSFALSLSIAFDWAGAGLRERPWPAMSK